MKLLIKRFNKIMLIIKNRCQWQQKLKTTQWSITEQSCQPIASSPQNQENFKAKRGRSCFFPQNCRRRCRTWKYYPTAGLATQSGLLPLGKQVSYHRRSGPYLKSKHIYTHTHIDFFPHDLLLYVSSI